MEITTTAKITTVIISGNKLFIYKMQNILTNFIFRLYLPTSVTEHIIVVYTILTVIQ